jgi:hypothetical protein
MPIRDKLFLDNNLKSTILLGLILREFFSFWTGHYDFEVFVRVGYYVARGSNPYSYLRYVEGLSFIPYDVVTSIGYPPFIALFATSAYLISSYLELGRFSYYLLLKQPMILGDVMTSIILYKLIKKIRREHESALKIVKYWLLNPFTIIISSIWGMIDPLVIMLLLFSIYLFCKKNKYYDLLAGTILGISIFVKQISAIYVPLFFLARKKSLEYLLIAISTAILLSVSPFLVFNWSFEGFYLCMKHQALEKLSSSEIAFFPFSGYIQGFTQALSIMWIPSLTIIYCLLTSRLSGNLEDLIKYSAITTSIFLLTRISVSEQLFEYVLIFVLLYYGTSNCEKSYNFYKALSILLLVYLISNNTLLVRFLSPLTVEAFHWDIYVNNTPPFDTIRFTIRSLSFFILSLTCIELIFFMLKRKRTHPFLIRKAEYIISNRKEVIFYLTYLFTVLSINFLSVNFIKGWEMASEEQIAKFYLIDAYHLPIFILSILLALLLAFIKTQTKKDRILVFIRLLFINLISFGLLIPLSQVVANLVPLQGHRIFLFYKINLKDRTFFKLLLFLGTIGLFFLNELSLAIHSVTRYLHVFKKKYL